MRKIDSVGDVLVVVALLRSLTAWNGSDALLLRKEMAVSDGLDGRL